MSGGSAHPKSRLLGRRVPVLSWTVELRWVLAHAYAPLAAPAVDGDSDGERTGGETAVRLAEALGLDARIASRGGARLAAELDEDAARRLERRRLLAAGVSLSLDHAVAELSAAAVAAGCEIALLKGGALVVGGFTARGSRPLGDVDVLALPAEAAPRLRDELRRRGYADSGQRGYPHHLAPLSRAGSLVVEIHTLVLGVTTDVAKRASGWRQVDGMAAVWLPPPAVLAAHVIAHAVAQHGRAPGSYPLLRAVGDLLDLGVTKEPELAGAALDELAPAVGPAGAVLLELAAALAAGSPETASPGARDLLAHFVAGALDPRYRRRLKLLPPRLPSVDESGFARHVWEAVWLSRGQIDALYGRPRGAAGYFGRRLLRPLDLAWRVVRSAAAWLPQRRAAQR